MEHLKEFEPDNKEISAYLKCVELYFAVNDIKERQLPIFLSVIGTKIYSLLRDLLVLTNPKKKSFNELAEVLKNQFEPKPLAIAERFTFHHGNQSSTESVLDYVAELTMPRHALRVW